ncbi:uncharacterized protein LOC133903153 [Phragmites australis]|uniref:uncharacterized protein LOC133903153 n=1 Tax=Phragmites australis TaxID=29695 RepID=UPI002D776CB0|nr:uncharacterized protein LOC133903153 [Phragmites australis]
MVVLARSSAASGSATLLLLALLACAAAAAARGSSACDTAICGKGKCTEGPGWIPTFDYECNCDPGWSRASELVPFSPCIVPNCSINSACFNFSLPKRIPTDICDAVSCGAGGACEKGDGFFVYSCECQPGYVNLLNLTAFPCAKNCTFGKGCSALGLAPPENPKPVSPPSPAPPADHDSSGPSAPSSSTKGNATTSLGSTPHSHHAFVHCIETWSRLLILHTILETPRLISA